MAAATGSSTGPTFIFMYDPDLTDSEDDEPKPGSQVELSPSNQQQQQQQQQQLRRGMYLSLVPGASVDLFQRLEPTLAGATHLAVSLTSLLNTCGGTILIGVDGGNQSRVEGVAATRRWRDQFLQMVDRTLSHLVEPRVRSRLVKVDFIPVVQQQQQQGVDSRRDGSGSGPWTSRSSSSSSARGEREPRYVIRVSEVYGGGTRLYAVRSSHEEGEGGLAGLGGVYKRREKGPPHHYKLSNHAVFNLM